LIAVYALSFVHFCSAEVNEQDASLAVSRADEAIKAAYGAVVEAEKAGGDVSSLVSALNWALDGFSEGKMAFDSGIYDVALPLADGAVDIADSVHKAAVELKGSAEYARGTTFRNTLIISAGLVFVIILLGFVGWRYFKDYYARNIVRMRPEVSVNEPG
jgi:hypothetical protein